ncbi:hypothetical protein Dimus_030796, partial [Dionaea muscipula]
VSLATKIGASACFTAKLARVDEDQGELELSYSIKRPKEEYQTPDGTCTNRSKFLLK